MNQREALLKHAKHRFGTEPDFPFKQFPNYAVLRHPDSEHWFALLMIVPRSKLKLEGDGDISILDVKSRPESVGSLRKQRGFLPAYHMNKEHWLTILLDGTVENETLHELLEDSFNLTK